MVATKTTPQPAKKRWTLKQFRQRHSDLRHSPMDVDAWHTLYRWIWPITLSGFVVSFFLALSMVWLILFKTPHTVPFSQEEHGMVQPLVTYNLPTDGATHGR